MQKIFIINGSGGVGKDTFVEMVSKIIPTMNYSSVDKVKEIAKQIGWNGISKTEKDRKFLSDLKILTSEYCDMPFQDMMRIIKEYHGSDCRCLFLHIREPKEIRRAVMEFSAESILITRDSVEPITTNMADANVHNYQYDYTINNNGTLEELEIQARKFVYNYVLDASEQLKMDITELESFSFIETMRSVLIK